MKQRRVATGQSADGKSVIVADESIEPVMVALAPGLECFPIWGSDRAVNLPHDGSKPLTSGWFPPQSGFRFTILTIPPDDQAAPPADIKAALAEASEKLPGMLEAVDGACSKPWTPPFPICTPLTRSTSWWSCREGSAWKLTTARKSNCPPVTA